jgi:tRNA pseudouridine55 synthase
MNGIIVINKPAAMSSAAVVAHAKRMLQVEKAGHTGTLDPFARGVLVCCINAATRLARFFVHSAKTYDAVMTIGVETDTQDATGRVIARRPTEGVTEQALERALKAYRGAVAQSPPPFSALKHKGVPLYTLARQGTPVQKPPRQVLISELRVRDIAWPRVRFEVSCSAGTYIRTLCADIGRDLGTGGHLSELTRLASGGFTLAQAVGLEELAERARMGVWQAVMVPMERALPDMPEVRADDRLIRKISHGRRLTRSEVSLTAMPAPPPREAYIKVLDPRGSLAAVLRAMPDKEELEYCCVFARSEGAPP